MSTQSRRLVQRNRNTEQPSPGPRVQQRANQATESERIELPPYEPPSCPLSADAKRKLENLRIESGTLKYKKHIAGAIGSLQVATPECHEALLSRKAMLEKLTAKRKNRDDDEELDRECKEAERYVQNFEKAILRHTTDAEKALRDLIDYQDELAMHDSILKEVTETVEADAANRPVRRQRRRGAEDEDEDLEEDAPAQDPEIMSTVELLKKGKEDYSVKYLGRTMRARYAENNEYKKFKQAIHEATYEPEDRPVMPHSRTWFEEENQANNTPSSRRRHNNDDEDDDDDIQIAGVTDILRCPLTLQYFNEPYSNCVCNHIFEKSAIIGYIDGQGTVFMPPTQEGGRRVGVKQAKCPSSGCEKMLSLADFQDDALTLRKVLRKKKKERTQHDEDPDDQAPRGTQRNNPEEIEDGIDVDVDVDVDENVRRTKQELKIKRERAKSRGLGGRRVDENENEDEEMED